MGILDEAIREHLELKRRRGATESELRQVEEAEGRTEEAALMEGEEAPIESLDTVEHPFPEEEPGDGPAGEQPEDAVEDDDRSARSEPERAGDDEDVLADTPEFLKDAPEDDELWFEQGEPKDFDF